MSGLRRELRASPGGAPGISFHRSAARWRHNRGTGVRVEPAAAISLRAMRTIVFLSHSRLTVVACPMDPLFNLAWIRPRANIHRPRAEFIVPIARPEYRPPGPQRVQL